MTRVSVVMTVRGEPPERLARAIGAVERQHDVGGMELVVAAPAGDLLELPTGPGRGAIVDAKIVDNPSGERSAGLNRAVEAARGDVVCRVDARSVVPVDYVRRCLDRLDADSSIGIVGGIQRPRPLGDRIVERGIARALANPWALGAAPYRRGDGGGPVDTVYLGGFRRDELLEMGGYDENLTANEDFELCARYRHRGYGVWLEPGLVVDYEPRTRLWQLLAQYFAFGRSKGRFWRLTGERPAPRQVAAIGSSAALVALAAASASRPRRLAAGMSLAAFSALALDHAVEPTESDVRVRLAALPAYGLVLGGWVGGIAVELVGRRAPDRRSTE